MYRTATVITLEECSMCYLDKNAYEKSLLEMNEKHQRTLINYFLKNPVFKGIDKKKFHMKYFNLLTLQKLNFREKLIQENEEGKYVYFLKSGEYEISFKKTLLETEDFIKLFEGKEYINKLDTENGYEDLRLQKFLNQAKFMKITIIHDQEVIGLEDMIDDKRINIFTVTSISYGCEYYRVDREVNLNKQSISKLFMITIHLYDQT
jgi:CRP-like cAMP-binding protein